MIKFKEIFDAHSKHVIEVVAAHLNGDVVEYCGILQFPVKWERVSYLHKWDFCNRKYRVIKKPREFWLNIYDKGIGEGDLLSDTFLRKSLAEANACKSDKASVESVHVIEVLE
jgi:hypothetical protein